MLSIEIQRLSFRIYIQGNCWVSSTLVWQQPKFWLIQDTLFYETKVWHVPPQKFGMGHHKSLAVAKLSKLRIILGNNIVHFCWYKYRVQSPLEFSLLWLLEVETLSPSLAARAVNRGDESCIRFCLFSFIRCLSVHLPADINLVWRPSKLHIVF